MTDWQLRVIEEQDQLTERISKLRRFTYGETYEGLDHDEKMLLKDQLGYMIKYSNILCERIAAFQ